MPLSQQSEREVNKIRQVAAAATIKTPLKIIFRGRHQNILNLMHN